ncbi:MAG: ribosome recycling factor [Candidatus Aminicenantes bacterium]|nr:MAG: ribosome recycling factor [Candidatus Aminicenantes bacterium]
MVKETLKEIEKKMKISAEHFRKDLSRMRTGRANLSLFEDIKVDYYGTQTPINQVATLGVPDPTLITIQPYDPSFLENIERAIQSADLGLNPINDGKQLKVPIPPLDEERRKDLAKHIRSLLEEEKTALRIMRREAKEEIEFLEKEKEITEDDRYWGYEKLQEITDQYIKKIEELADAKEKEILEL